MSCHLSQGIPSDVKWTIRIVLIGISLIAKRCWPFKYSQSLNFLCLEFSVYICTTFFVCFLDSFLSTLCILHIRSLVLDLVVHLFPFCKLLLCLNYVSFALQKLLRFMKSHLLAIDLYYSCLFLCQWFQDCSRFFLLFGSVYVVLCRGLSCIWNFFFRAVSINVFSFFYMKPSSLTDLSRFVKNCVGILMHWIYR